MARRSDHTREELHDMIVATARGIIVEHGIARLSTRAIAGAIGYTPGTLYQHFKDISEIVLHVNEQTMLGLVEEMAQARSTATDDARGMIHKYADVYLDYVRSNDNAWDALFHFRRPSDESVPEWYLDLIGKLISLVEECFADLERGNELTTPLQAAQMAWASVHSVCSLEGGGRLKMIMERDLETVIHQLVDVHIKAYECKSAMC